MVYCSQGRQIGIFSKNVFNWTPQYLNAESWKLILNRQIRKLCSPKFQSSFFSAFHFELCSDLICQAGTQVACHLLGPVVAFNFTIIIIVSSISCHFFTFSLALFIAYIMSFISYHVSACIYLSPLRQFALHNIMNNWSAKRSQVCVFF